MRQEVNQLRRTDIEQRIERQKVYDAGGHLVMNDRF